MSDTGVFEPYDEWATDALGFYGLSHTTPLMLLNVSENATFRVGEGDEARILRIHRPDYHSNQAIESELDWVAALRESQTVVTAACIPAEDGRRIVTTRSLDGRERNAVMFEFLPGREPAEDDLIPAFFELGAVTARLHQHSKAWERPAGFTRFRWDFDTSIGEQGHWGHWRNGMEVGPAESDLFSRTAARIQQRLADYGDGPDRFGLVHADLRLANLLIDGDSVSVIDFDDCGYSWYMYDFATAVSFIEDHPDIPRMQARWIDGYQSVASLAADDIDILSTLVMLRRLLLVAWIGGHSSTELAQSMGPDFTRISVTLAEEYLSQNN